MSRRPYDARRRQQAAFTSRQKLLQAARLLFVQRGYAATTLADIAQRADVSVATASAAFGGKAGLLKRLMDVAVAGDEAPAAVAERPQARAIAEEPDPDRQVDGFAELVTQIHQRLADLQAVLVEASGADSDVRDLQTRGQIDRRKGMQEFVDLLDERGALRPGLSPEAAADMVWALTDPRLYLGLCRERGWTDNRYRRFLAAQVKAALLAGGSSRSTG